MIRLLLFLSTVTLASCTSVRLAIYDYQKRQAYAKEDDSTAEAYVPKASPAKQELTKKATEYLGASYRYGSCDPKKGFDCSGLVYHVAKSQEIDLPRSSSLMAGSGPHISWKKAEPGDLIFFGEGNRVNHVGIVEKNKGNQIWIIHSSSSNGVLREDIMESDYWKSRALFAIDIIASKNIKS